MAVTETGSQETRNKPPHKEKNRPVVKQLKIKLVRSLIGRPRKQREIVKGLGLRRVNSEVVRKQCPEIMGMIKKIPHLLKVEELDIK